MRAREPDACAREPLLSEQLECLRLAFADRRATMGEVIGGLKGRAYTLLIVVFALPFVPPVTVPGASTPLGIVIASIALQLAVERLPWLPQRFLRWSLPAGFFGRLVPMTARIVRKLERILHPRWPRWTGTALVRGTHYAMIATAALLLAVPVPVPFSNVLPGWAILLTGFGLLERDGRCILAGYVAFVLTVVFFVLIGSALTEGANRVWDWAR